MAEAATASTAPPGRHQRRLRNYLLDSHFQLKYSGYLVLIAVLLSGSLGIILWRTSVAVIEQSHEAVDQGEQVVSLGREVVKESQKVSKVVEMNIVKDPVYADNPALAEAFKVDAAVQEERLREQQAQLEAQAASLRKQSQDLLARQRTLFTTLLAVLSLLVVLIGFAGIVVTHKVAGPIFKMKRQIKSVADGHLAVPGQLRKGDELVDFFEVFREMVVSLRRRQEQEIALLESAIGTLEGGSIAKSGKCENCGTDLPPVTSGDVALKPLYEVRNEMKAALDA